MKHSKLLAACLTVGFSTAVIAEDISPADVVFSEYGVVEASLTGVAGDPVNGASLFKNRKLGNCLACHQNSDMLDQPFHGEVGPTLDGVADRYSAEEIRGIITNSKNTFDGTIMPAFYVDSGYFRPTEKFEGRSILTAQDIEDVLAYLLTLTE